MSLTAMLTYPFMQRALIAGVLVSLQEVKDEVLPVGLLGDGYGIVPTTDRNQPDPRVDAHAPLIYLDRDVQKAAALREKALNGDMEALLHLAVLSRVGEEEGQPPLFGASAAFWED